MEKFIEHLQRSFSKSDIGFRKLGKVILKFPFKEIKYQHLLDESSSSDTYHRIPLIDSPLEVTLLHWPPGAESAVHWHQGFYGYVLVLDGRAEDISYSYKQPKLCRKSRGVFFKHGLLAEPDGVIHKIINADKTKSLTTLHIYYPAIKSFQGMKLFNIPERKIGTLDANAKNASWSDEAGHFSNIQTDAFEYSAACHDRSHESVLVCPKPETRQIQSMISAYYNEQAEQYDNFDVSHQSRSLYTSAVDKWITREMDQLASCRHMIDIACGTGRRTEQMATKSRHQPEITGVDISENMLRIAANRGIHTIQAPFTLAQITENQFDVATYLYAFGHIPNSELRVKTLKKIHRVLKSGGSFFADFFSVENKNEWGPDALKSYKKHKLKKFGYEAGDIFYTKPGGSEIAFLHYFSADEITGLLQSCGFEIRKIAYFGYVNNPGEPVADNTEGNMLIHAVKK